MIEISFDDILKLEKIKNDGIDRESEHNALPSSDEMPQIKVNIIFNEKKYRGDIRLKGDRGYWEDREKSSYKIELDKNQYLFE